MKIEFKKAIFTPYQIIIKKKKRNIVIPLSEVDRMFYAKFSIKNYLSLGFGDCRTTNFLYIYLKEKINGRKLYCFYIKYCDLVKIPKNILKKIEFYGQEELW